MMEGYIDIENDAASASNAITKTVEGQGYETLRQTLQITRQLELETERIQSANLGVFKATSENATKRLKMRKETGMTARAAFKKEIKWLKTQKEAFN